MIFSGASVLGRRLQKRAQKRTPRFQQEGCHMIPANQRGRERLQTEQAERSVSHVASRPSQAKGRYMPEP
jgi:hypothetical protein